MTGVPVLAASFLSLCLLGILQDGSWLLQCSLTVHARRRLGVWRDVSMTREGLDLE